MADLYVDRNRARDEGRDEWMRRAGPFYPGLVALCALTVVPLPRGLRPNGEDATRAAKWFPAVGAVLGVALVALSEMLLWMGFTPAVVALVVVACWVAMAGTGWLRGVVATAQRASVEQLSPVADATSVVGPLALIGLLAMKVAALLATDTESWAVSLFLAAVMAHWCVLLLLHVGGDQAGPDQGERPHLAVGPVSLPGFGFGSAIAAAITVFALAVAGAVALLSLVLVALAAVGLGALLRHRFGRLGNRSLATVAGVCGLLVLLAFSLAHPAVVSPWIQ